MRVESLCLRLSTFTSLSLLPNFHFALSFVVVQFESGGASAAEKGERLVSREETAMSYLYQTAHFY